MVPGRKTPSKGKNCTLAGVTKRTLPKEESCGHPFPYFFIETIRPGKGLLFFNLLPINRWCAFMDAFGLSAQERGKGERGKGDTF